MDPVNDYGVRTLRNVQVPIRDGAHPSTDFYFPVDVPVGAPHPRVLSRTSHDKQTPVYVEMSRHLTGHGYAVVLQDVREQRDSAGSSQAFGMTGERATTPWSGRQRSPGPLVCSLT